MGRMLIGVDLGGTNLRTALLNPKGEILEKRKEASRASEGYEKVLRRLIETIQSQRKMGEQKGGEVLAIGVGAPGVIDIGRGIVVKSPNFPDWNNLPLKAALEKELRIPVYVENDANAAALGEQWMGAGRDVGTMILITLGTGVGGGIVLDGKIWHGADGMAGELGHMTILPDGRQCGCGNTGCLEMYASARGVIQNYRDARQTHGQATSDDITSERVYQAAREGDEAAVTALKETGRYLGIGIANLVNIFNPQKVVIGGGVKDAWDLFIGTTRLEVRKRAFEVPAERTQIVASLLGDDAGIVGAAAVALQRTQGEQQ